MALEHSTITPDNTRARAGSSRVLFDTGQQLVIKDEHIIALAEFGGGRLVLQDPKDDLGALTGYDPAGAGRRPPTW